MSLFKVRVNITKQNFQFVYISKITKKLAPKIDISKGKHGFSFISALLQGNEYLPRHAHDVQTLSLHNPAFLLLMSAIYSMPVHHRAYLHPITQYGQFRDASYPETHIWTVGGNP